MSIDVPAFRSYIEALHALHEDVVNGRCHPPDEWLEAVAEGALTPTAEQLCSVLGWWWGSHERAHVFADWWEQGVICPDVLTGLVNEDYGKPEPLILDVWSDLKAGGADPHVWVKMFKAAGFVSDGQPRPEGDVVAYRGDRYGRWRGMSWTTDLDCAHGFAEWFDFNHTGVVFEATLRPHQVLALYGGRGESEVIVNPFSLRGPTDRRGPPGTGLGAARPEPCPAVARWREGSGRGGLPEPPLTYRRVG